MERDTRESALIVDDIKKYFPIKGGLMKPDKWLKAVDGVSFTVKRESVFALVGESGSGKSTVARLILKLLPLTGGKIVFNGRDISTLEGEELKGFRKSMQIIFQDPFASLNPRMRILDALAEPFRIHHSIPRREVRDRVVQLLEKVGLNADALHKYPHEFSGGQRQRICIARALTVSPELIIADEPLSALDVSIQAQILNLLQEIRKESALSLVFISHDLHVVQYISDEVAVMYLGKIVEQAKTDDLFSNPKHPYTELLLSSAPRIKVAPRVAGMDTQPRTRGLERANDKDIPSPVDVPSGCPFSPRCPRKSALCEKQTPALVQMSDRLIACHYHS